LFEAARELERKRKAEQSVAYQVAALREMVVKLVEGQEELRGQLRKQGEEAKEQAAEDD